MIDISSERLVAINQAHQHVPGRPHKSTIFRWALHGVRGQKLDSLIAGGRRFTSIEAIERFCSRLTNPGAPAPSDARRAKARIAAANAVLDQAGI
jgi:hypothetical protein